MIRGEDAKLKPKVVGLAGRIDKFKNCKFHIVAILIDILAI